MVVSAAAPLLVTGRLELWLPTCADIAPMLAIVVDPATGRFLGRTQSRADHFARFSRNAGSWLLYGYGSFMLRERATGELLGNCGVFHSFRGLGEDFDDSPEAGWILRADRVGQGLAHEAMTAALAWFESEHGRQRIVCMTAPENAPSIRLAEKLGFSAMREAELPDGDAVRLFERPVAGGG
jgi:RimJ/RimL family protein N-acetyltransferase